MHDARPWFVILLHILLITFPVFSKTSIPQLAGEWQTEGISFTSEDVPLLTDTNSSFFFNLEIDFINNNLSITQDDIISLLQTQFPISTANQTTTLVSAELMTKCTIYPQELNCSCGSMYRFPPNVCSLYGCGSPLNSPCTCASASNTNITMLDCEPMVPTTMAPTLTTHFSTSTMAHAFKACLSAPLVLQTPTEASMTSTFPSTNKLEVAATINLTIDMDFIPEFNNASSREFKCLKKLMEELLTNTYKGIPGFAQVEILGFFNGSVLIQYQVKGNNITDEDIFNKTSVELRQNLLENDILSIKLPVIEKFGIIKSPKQHQMYQDGKEAVFSCFYPTTVRQRLRWWKQDKLLSSKSDWTKSNLRAADSGMYICEITANNTLYVDNVDIHVVEFPKNIKTNNVSLNPGEIGNVSCCLIDWPDHNVPFNVTWHDLSGTLLRKEVMKGDSATKCTFLMVNNTQRHENLLETYICTFSISPLNVSGKVHAEFHLPYTNPTPTPTMPTTTIGTRIIAPDGEIKEADDVQLICEMPVATTAPTWRIDGSSIANGSIFKINQINNTTSLLEIKGIKPAYEGEYSCSAVQDLKTYEAKHRLIGVIAKPIITKSTLPFTQTCGNEVSLECCATSSSPTNISWTWRMITNEGTIKNNCSSFTLQISNPCLQNESVKCAFTNVAGSAMENITISIISGNESFCSQTLMGDYKWEKTKAESMAYQYCPVGTEGKVSQWCDREKWSGDIIENCISKDLQGIQENAKLLQAGIGNATDKVKELLRKLHKFTNTSQGNLYLGELQVASEILAILTSVSEDNDVIITDDTMKDVVMITDSLVNEDFSDLWQKIDENSKSGGSEILKSVEGLTKLYRPNKDDFSILARNVELKGKRFVNPESGFQQKFPDKTSILIPSEFLSSKNITVTSIYLPTMSKILPKRFPTLDKNYSVGSAVLSTVITNNNNNNNMEITMAFTIFSNNSNPYDSLCTFWDYSANGEWSSTGCNETVEGNQTMCTCNHLTSFSVLISPKTVTSLGLEIITYVGVGISIGALVVALIIEILIWRFVKKDQISKIRHIILVNICLTLLFADIWFLMAASPLAKESFCIALTFLMHFFYMGLFFWMLCDGSFLFYKVAFPFHFATSTIITRYLFILGYVCPTIITVTTIAVTQPRNIYRREETCWLNWDQSRALLAFIVPAFIIVGINFIFLVVVLYKICTQGRMGVSTNKDDIVKLQRIMRSLAIKMPVLGTTWGIGIFAFAPGAAQNEGLHYTFAILNAFQGLLILIVDFMMDKAVLKALRRVICGHTWGSNAPSSSQSPQSGAPKTKTKSKPRSTVPEKYAPL
uniref:adhesion G-protein coupled receptor F3-like n=1 Tax=Myxine glutinosa TaxID=7769 RepID=UPI00358F34A9